MKKWFVFLVCFLATLLSNAQILFYQDLCNCGVTGAGFSTALGSGNGNFNVYIEPGSTIKKAWLFAQRIGISDSVGIIINGIDYNFNFQNQVTTNYYAIGGNSAIHAIDVTNYINPSVTSYNVIIPPQINIHPNSKYRAVYLWIQYEKAILPMMNSVILLNDFDLNNNIINYQASNLTPININNPVGFSIYTDNLGDTLLPDGSYIYIYNDLLGLIGGSDASSNLWTHAGVRGHFYYQNDSLFGLDDDTPDSLMAASDGLADISSYLTNNDTTFDFMLEWQNQFINDAANYYGGFFLTYTTPCDTFTTTVTANDTICLGDPLQLQATGGVQYSWFGAFGGLNDTAIANPMASPLQTTTYIVTIKNDSGCVKTEQVKVWVNPLPEPSQNVITENVCGDKVGSITVGAISNGGQPFNYQLFNLLTSNSQLQTSNTFNQLDTGFYLLTTRDNNGCEFTEIITITETNNVTANFTATPESGIAPLEVNFENNSTNANAFEWWVVRGERDTTAQYSIPSIQHLFKNSGTFETCLIVYNNIPRCADTICKTIIVTDELSFIIPNVFTPNGDDNNDNFVIQVTGTSLIKELNVEIYNRWGQKVGSREFEVNRFSQTPNTNNQQLNIWDGRTTTGSLTPEGTYFYVMSYTTIDDEVKSEKGSLTLLK